MPSLTREQFSILSPEERLSIQTGSLLYTIIPSTPKPKRRLVLAGFSQVEVDDAFIVPKNLIYNGQNIYAMQVPQAAELNYAIASGTDWVFGQIDFGTIVSTPIPTPIPTATPKITPTPIVKKINVMDYINFSPIQNSTLSTVYKLRSLQKIKSHIITATSLATDFSIKITFIPKSECIIVPDPVILFPRQKKDIEIQYKNLFFEKNSNIKEGLYRSKFSILVEKI